jgi:flagellar hook-basal body complex protein FliE
MASEINFNKAASAYQNTAGLQSAKTSVASLTESPHLQGESPTAFKPSFESLLGEALDKARDAGYKGEGVSAESVAGKAEYHQLVTAVNNADLTLRTVVAVRDRLINAYNDMLKMPI